MSLIDLEPGILEGVTKPTIEKIRKAGITTVEALSRQVPETLSENAKIGGDTAERAIQRAVKLISQGYITGKQLKEERSTRTSLHTGSDMLDTLLGGGIESETTTELIGDYATGKTQICHTLAVLAQLSIEEGGLGGKVAWVDTEDTFRPERIEEICKARGIDPESTLLGIWHVTSYNTPHQKLVIRQLYELCPEKGIKLIIVDSILGHLRSEYVGRGTLSRRQDSLKEILLDLRKVALSTKTTVVYTNQVLSDPSVLYGNPERPTGGHVMAHAASTRLHLRKGRQNVRFAKLIDSLSLPEGEAPFVIDEYGIRDTKGNRGEEDAENP